MSVRRVASSQPFALGRPLAVLLRLPARLRAAADLHRSRRRLVQLDDHILRDIGLSRAEALAEAERAPWDAPGHWRV